MSNNLEQIDSIINPFVFTEIVSTKIGELVEPGTCLTENMDYATVVDNLLIKRDCTTQLRNWWRAFINPHAIHSIPHNPDVKACKFKYISFALLSPERNCQMYNKTHSIDNQPESVSYQRALDMHRSMVRSVIVSEFPELDELLEPTETLLHKYENYLFGVCNYSYNSLYMVVPFVTDYALIGRLSNDSSMLVFMNRCHNIKLCHKSLKTAQ